MSNNTHNKVNDFLAFTVVIRPLTKQEKVYE